MGWLWMWWKMSTLTSWLKGGVLLVMGWLWMWWKMSTLTSWLKGGVLGVGRRWEIGSVVVGRWLRVLSTGCSSA